MKTTLSVLVLVCLFLGVARSSGQQLPSAVPQPGTRVSVTDGATFGVAPALITADPFVWRIQDENPEEDTPDRATDAGKTSDLRLSIDRVETTSTRREFRISISGIQSVDQAVNVWVSNDLKTWNKLDDSMIQTNERGERRILTPLNAGMQFFRVTLVE